MEQKTYLDPFDPPKQEKPDHTVAAAIGIGGLVLGVILAAIGEACLGTLLIVGGPLTAFVMAQRASAAPKKELDEAIKSWAKDVTNLARRAEISDELNRTAQALDEAVKLAVDRLFTQRGAEMEADERRRRTAAQIQEELERRKKEGFG